MRADFYSQRCSDLSACIVVLSVFSSIILMCWPLSSAIGQTVSATVRTQADQLYGDLNSPFCPGRLLKDCPSSGAVALKNEIVDRLVQGEEPVQIRKELVARYGDEIDPLPQFSGFGLVAWGAPAFFLLIGGVLIVRWLRVQLRGGDTV